MQPLRAAAQSLLLVFLMSVQAFYLHVFDVVSKIQALKFASITQPAYLYVEQSAKAIQDDPSVVHLVALLI
jgi:hypothetical protein